METMKTDKNAPKQAPPKHPLTTELAQMEGIPVLELRFCVQGGRDLPYVDSNGGMGTLRAREDRDVCYLPKVMLYRVVQRSRDPKVKTKTFYIPREWATFEPLE
jgi:hypothetical protein